MADLFGTIASGYAKARPPVHPRIVERVRDHLRLSRPVGCALDVGCGAGLSTRPLSRLSRRCVGVEPSEGMLRWSREVAPEAHFCVGRAEALPVRSSSADLITAAGSLNYADPARSFPEVVRVLAPGGVLVVYDFSPGRRLAGSSVLDDWYSEFERRYPAPPGVAIELDPEILQSFESGLRLVGSERFEIPVTLTVHAYLDYVMTETNVVHAVAQGIPEGQIRTWCSAALGPVFAGEGRGVLFDGYIAYLAV